MLTLNWTISPANAVELGGASQGLLRAVLVEAQLHGLDDHVRELLDLLLVFRR